MNDTEMTIAEREVENYRNLRAECNRHEAMVNMVKNSEEYEAITKQLKELKEKQQAMLPTSDAPNNLYEAEKEITDALVAGVVYDGVIPKYKETKAVNNNMVLEAIGGDFGIYQELSSITQKSLKDFAKTQPGLKSVLNNCIQVTSRKITGFEVDFTN